jgi:hypothetical protein
MYDSPEKKKAYDKAYREAHKEIVKAYQAIYRETHKERRKEYDLLHKERITVKTKILRAKNAEKIRKQSIEASRRAREKYPERTKVRRDTLNAIRDKRLVRGPCEVCGSHDVQAHHVNYAYPDAIRWLCIPHHNELHGEFK